VGNGVLAGDDVAVCKTDFDVVREVGVDGGQDGCVARYRTDAGEKVDCGFK
jgi:hypothetical protein